MIISGSKAEVGSSNSMILGCIASARDGHALLLPTGKLGRVLVGLLGDPYPLQKLHGDSLRLGTAPLAHLDGGEGDVLEHLQVGEEIERLEDHPDLAANRLDVANIVAELNAIDDDPTPLVLLQPVDYANEGGFPRSRGAEDDDDLPSLDGGGEAPQDVKAAEPLVYVSTDDDVVYQL